MGRTSKPLPGRPMPIHSIPETSNRSSTSRHTENGANFQNRQTPNVLIPSVPGGCEDVLRDHRDRLLQETLTENENSEVREVAKRLRERVENRLEWDFTKALRDDVNEVINNAIRERVLNVHKDASAVELQAALKSHFLTRRKRSKRVRSGVLGRHQKVQRKKQRKVNLLKSRSKAADASTTMTPGDKEKVKSVMKLEYMSSEESMSEDDDNDEDNAEDSASDNEGGPPKKRKVLIKHPLP
ncbi:hypothetical protein AC249_AIPGENE12874 [Exaiptasia diaphana]|nr:hypothetical protein AC249_AIPGENE12874 [Exaiptasia diaphana]